MAQPDGVLDTLGMFAAAAELPAQIQRAADGARDIGELPDRDEIENVVVLGMGGSGIAGDLLAVTAGPFMPVPVLVHKGYGIPNFISERSLVFAVSFSGNTEEVVEGATEAASAGGRVVCISHDGELLDLANQWGVPHVRIGNGIPMPRAGIGAVSIPPMVVLEQMGLFPGASSWISAAVEQLVKRVDELTSPDSEAERLARRLSRSIPLVYGGGGLGAVAAMRWKNQFNENCKVPAFWNSLPEMCHNELAGFGQYGDLTRQVLRVVNLRHEFEHPQIGRRFELVGESLGEVVGEIESVVAEGEGRLAQLLDLILVGDFVTLHVAAQEGIDPGPIPVLDDLKAALAAD